MRSRKLKLGSPAIGNSRSVLSTATNARYPVAADTSAGSSKRRASSSWYGTSIAKIAPVAGALKIAATPAAAPATISKRRSASRKSRGRRRWVCDPIVAPR